MQAMTAGDWFGVAVLVLAIGILVFGYFATRNDA